MSVASTTRRGLLAGLGSGLWLAAWSRGGAALAQAPQPGRVTTRAFARLAAPLTVMVSTPDDSAASARLRAEFERTLARAGHRVVARDAPWRLSFAAEVRLAGSAGSGGRGGPPPAADAARPSELGHDQLPDRPLLRRDPPARAGAPSHPRHVVNATLEEMRNGRTRWQGHVRYDAPEQDPAGLLARLVPVLMAEFGKTVVERRFVLD